MSLKGIAQNDLILAGLALAALFIFSRNAGSIGSAAGTAAVDAVTGAAKGIGDAANGAINGTVEHMTGTKGQTLGGWVFDILHPGTVADANGNIPWAGTPPYFPPDP